MNQQLQNLIETGHLRYLVGYAEEVLPLLKNSADILIEVASATTYSPDKIRLFELYYAALKSNGVAKIALYSDVLRNDVNVQVAPNKFVSMLDFVKNKFPNLISIRGFRLHGWIVVDITKAKDVDTIDFGVQIKKPLAKYLKDPRQGFKIEYGLRQTLDGP